MNFIEPYLDHLQRPVADLEQPVGILVAINGKIESIDVFESTPLFLKLWPKLLKSYALDAANSREESDEKPQECTLAAHVVQPADTDGDGIGGGGLGGGGVHFSGFSK